MERVLEDKAPASRKSPSKNGLPLIFPGETAWEKWDLPSEGSAVFKSTGPLPEISGRTDNRTCLALPLHQVIVLPIWLSTLEAPLMREMVMLQLERRGFNHTDADMAMDYQVLRREGERSLLSVCLLPENFPNELCFPRIHSYGLASDFWALPTNQLLVWKELDNLVLAFTSGEGLVYAQSSQSPGIHPSFVHEAHCARLLLESEDVLPSLHGITVLGDFTPRETEHLGKSLHLPLQHLDRPSPRLPKNCRKLIPSAVRQVQRQKRESRRLRHIVAAGAGLYLLLAFAFLGQLAWLDWQKKDLLQEAGTHQTEVADIRATFQRWQALEPALLADSYPIEILFRCTRALPEEGVRLLSYEQDTARVNLTGEAKNAPAAFQFVEALKKNPDLADYTWEMPSPDLLPNDSARFVIEGRRRDAPAQEQ